MRMMLAALANLAGNARSSFDHFSPFPIPRHAVMAALKAAENQLRKLGLQHHQRLTITLEADFVFLNQLQYFT
jgi:hypothetical protein